MEEFISSHNPNANNSTFIFKFHFEQHIKDQHNVSLTTQPPPPSSQTEGGICKFFLKGTCFRGSSCPYRHGRPEKSVVCKHWLRGLCKKGDLCEFLHEYNLKKMPECWFFSKYGECANPDCFYLHVDPTQRQKECLWYARGFCKHGPNCRNRHVRAVACAMYLTGFCPEGLQCDLAHPKYELPTLQ